MKRGVSKATKQNTAREVPHIKSGKKWVAQAGVTGLKSVASKKQIKTCK